MNSFVHRIFYVVAVPLLLAAGAVSIYMLVLKPVNTDMTLEPRQEEKTGGDEDESGPIISVRRPEISYLVDGRVTWRIFADSVDSDTPTGDTSLMKSSGVFFRDVENPEMKFEFESPLTMYNKKTKLVEARGKVTGRLLPEMYELEASGMKWSEEDGLFRAEDVVITSEKSVLRGRYLEIRPKEEVLTLTGGVQAEIVVNMNRGR